MNSWKIVDISRFFNDDDANGNETFSKENQSNDDSDEQTTRKIIGQASSKAYFSDLIGEYSVIIYK